MNLHQDREVYIRWSKNWRNSVSFSSKVRRFSSFQISHKNPSMMNSHNIAYLSWKDDQWKSYSTRLEGHWEKPYGNRRILTFGKVWAYSQKTKMWIIVLELAWQSTHQFGAEIIQGAFPRNFSRNFIFIWTVKWRQ